jgi:hypothetical protein
MVHSPWLCIPAAQCTFHGQYVLSYATSVINRLSNSQIRQYAQVPARHRISRVIPAFFALQLVGCASWGCTSWLDPSPILLRPCTAVQSVPSPNCRSASSLRILITCNFNSPAGEWQHLGKLVESSWRWQKCMKHHEKSTKELGDHSEHYQRPKTYRTESRRGVWMLALL